jgi:hypothetical protein
VNAVSSVAADHAVGDARCERLGGPRGRATDHKHAVPAVIQDFRFDGAVGHVGPDLEANVEARAVDHPDAVELIEPDRARQDGDVLGLEHLDPGPVPQGRTERGWGEDVVVASGLHVIQDVAGAAN